MLKLLPYTASVFNKIIPVASVYKAFFASMPNLTGYTEEYVKDKLQANLNATVVEVQDYSDGCGAKFNVLVVSPMFEGKSLLERHRLVNTIMAEELKTIHAFTQKTLTPEQWEKQKAS